ncbi:hypothetical protein [Leptospira stimsonii]|uniref:Uncharacterized protein n=1 Tax=Leptospira stimsonii TaxID=2202203 RepID=A0ABY2NDD9_9LEPT|nr:hypothetical protein [Leptospira stimsonii]TGK14205.1 hypothetical protein EHO98_17615 [Leptospira stimsonii]TGM22058.1 hypothetical protein EHQ90_01085 [Leptospira stimsonii]
MKQIQFLTEAALKKMVGQETIEFLFAKDQPSEAALKEFYQQLKNWAGAQNAKYCIEFPENAIDQLPLPDSLRQADRSIRTTTEFSNFPFPGIPSRTFPPFVWKNLFYFPFVAKEESIASKISLLEEKIAFERFQKTKKNGETQTFQLEFLISSETNDSLERILEAEIPENFVERILERGKEKILVTPKLSSIQSLFAIYLFNEIISDLEFTIQSVRIDLSSMKEILPVWIERSGSVLAGLDFENAPVSEESSLEITIAPWLSASFVFLVLNSSILDAWEKWENGKVAISNSNPNSKFTKSESWRDLTEHRFAARVARHLGTDEAFFFELLQKEFDVSKKILDSHLEVRKEALEEIEIPELLDRIKIIQESSQSLNADESTKELWRNLQSSTNDLILQKWKERNSLSAKKMDEIASASSWKSLIEIWKS